MHRAAEGRRRRLAGVDLEDGEVAVDVGAGELALGLAAVGEGDRGRAVAEVVGVGGDQPVGDDEAAAPSAAPPDADDGGADPVGGGAGGVAQGIEDGGHGELLVTCYLQVTVGSRPPHEATTWKMALVAADLPALDVAASRVGDRWTLLLVATLLDGAARFGELQEALPGVAPNILTKRLRTLEQEGLVVAEPYSRRPVRVAYRLTGQGAALADALRLLAQWGADHPARPERPGEPEACRCSTGPAARRSRPAGGAPPAQPSSTTTTPPTSAGSEPRDGPGHIRDLDHGRRHRRRSRTSSTGGSASSSVHLPRARGRIGARQALADRLASLQRT